jgi:hypothetical protein
VEAGWYAILRLPEDQDEYGFVLGCWKTMMFWAARVLLASDEGYVPEPADPGEGFSEGVRRILARPQVRAQHPSCLLVIFHQTGEKSRCHRRTLIRGDKVDTERSMISVILQQIADHGVGVGDRTGVLLQPRALNEGAIEPGESRLTRGCAGDFVDLP